MHKNFIPITLSLISFGCSQNSNNVNDYEILNKDAIACVPPAQMEVKPWGKTGLSLSCSIKSGPFVTAENGHIRLRGQYAEGKKVGIWRWYNPQGVTVKEIDYSTH